ncbi:MAG TPA: T9SS type A sorting domain-containing protein, partial [Bacteroidia bacterium]|nr:T9SS type A sorting domain-containing protein [Bacteroidia bacterium]
PVALYDSVHSLTYSSPCAGALGSVTIGVKGGTQPYTYTWTLGVSTTSNATALAARNYTVTVKDIHGCSSSVGFTINQVNAIRDSIVKTVTVNVSCFGANNGSATVGVKYGAAPYTYTWTPNVSSIATANGLSNGTYSVSVTDNNGCSGSTTSVIITQPQLLRDSLASSTDVGCYGGNGGSASIGTRGGTAPYTYLWSNGKTTYSISSLTYGTYTVSITDNHGCPNTVTGITITQPASPLTATIPTPICVGGGNGTITVNASGGTPGYTYLWSNGETNTTMTVVSATYTVKVSDVHGCNASSTVTFSCGPVVLNRRGEDDQRPADCCPSLTEVNLYPNPNMGQFTLSGLEQGMIVEIYDYTGRKINSRSVIHNSDLAINISDQSNGVYLIRILDKNGILVSQKKMVKTQ